MVTTPETVCWGLHRGRDGLLWLLQPSGAVNTWGVEGASPFAGHAAPCPHDLDLRLPQPSSAPLAAFQQLRDKDPLLAFLSAPGAGQAVVPESPITRILVRLYLRLWAAKAECVMPVEALTRGMLKRKLEETNLAPLVVTGCTPRFFDQARLAWVLAEVAPRRLLLLGGQIPLAPPLRGVPEPHEAEAAALLPWESLGTHLIRSMK